MVSTIELPSSESPDLYRSQLTPEECTQIWSNTATSWKDSLTVPLYLIESQYLTTIPLAKDGRMTTWSFRKRSTTSDERDNVEKGLVYGVASVFCLSEFRGRGYGTRHMKELAKVLHGWQCEYGKSIGSVPYSNIGQESYDRLGWLPNPRNRHFVFPPVKMEKPTLAQLVPESELEAHCLRDEVMVCERRDPREPWQAGLGSLNASLLRVPGPSHEEEEDGGNVLHILRLVVEGDDTAYKPHEDQLLPPTDPYVEQAAALKAVLQAAQAEAAKWRLDHVKLWERSPLAQTTVLLLNPGSIEAALPEKTIASALWFKEDGDATISLAPWFQWIVPSEPISPDDLVLEDAFLSNMSREALSELVLGIMQNVWIIVSDLRLSYYWAARQGPIPGQNGFS
ncbi:hypothetical protein F4818DRAFT_442320 [Hypoxylon cercidicola]|nr:hypothetical protein F4818DRAFT_442320 [Hypoxylon cercidicola]